jgi:membrane-associated protein
MLDLILHLDKHLVDLAATYGKQIYVILFMIIFCETGLVVTPFLPGDSLLFAVGSLAALGGLDFGTVLLLMSVAAVLGNFVNYYIGRRFGRAVIEKYPRIFKPHYIKQTEDYFGKYGNKTIVITRFAPIVRTFAPFLAGTAKMPYSQFVFYNLFGGLLWVVLLTGAGYLFGNVPVIKNNFSLVTIGIIVVSLMPLAWEIWKAKKTPMDGTSTSTVKKQANG